MKSNHDRARELMRDVMVSNVIPVRKTLELKALSLPDGKPIFGEIPLFTLIARVEHSRGFSEMHAEPPHGSRKQWKVWITGCDTQFYNHSGAWREGDVVGVYAEPNIVLELMSIIDGREYGARLDLEWPANNGNN